MNFSHERGLDIDQGQAMNPMTYSRGETSIKVNMAPIIVLRYTMPMLMTLSVLGNVMIVVTSCRQNLLKRTFTTYIAFLAMSDIAVTAFSGGKVLVFIFWGLIVELKFHCIW